MELVLLSILVLAMYHPADVFVNQMQIAEYVISLLPTGSHIHVGFVGYKYDELFDGSKEDYERLHVLHHFRNKPFTSPIQASDVIKYYRRSFLGTPGLPQVGLFLGCESRVNGDLKAIQELKKKTYVVVDITSPMTSLANIATSPDHVFSPFQFDGNRFSKLFHNDSQLACDTDMYLPDSGSCMPCMNSCEPFFPLNCTTQEIERQCKYYAKELKNVDTEVSADTSKPDYPTPIYFYDTIRLNRTNLIVITSVCFAILVIALMVLCTLFGPKVVKGCFQSSRAGCVNCKAWIYSKLPHRLFENIIDNAVFNSIPDEDNAVFNDIPDEELACV